MNLRLPIAITTYNRANYTRATIESLERSRADLSTLTIHDDASTEPDTHDLLEQLNRKYGIMRYHENRGTYQSTFDAIEYMFNHYVTQWVVILQNDVEVSYNWLERGMELLTECRNDHKIGIMSLYNRNENMAGKCKWFIMTEHGHPGGVAWIVNRKWWKEYVIDVEPMDGMRWLPTGDKRTDHNVRHLCDWKLCDACKRMGYGIGVVARSLVQHIGDKSSIQDRDMTFCRVRNYVGNK